MPSSCKKLKLQQLLLKSNIHATNRNRIHLFKHRHMINGLVNVLKVYNNSLTINSLNYAKKIFMALAEIDHRFNQLCNGLMKLESVFPQYTSIKMLQVTKLLHS